MESSGIKFIYLAVGLFISLAIVSGLFISIRSYTDAFDSIESSSMGLQGEFMELEKYNGSTLKGIDVLNTVKKYAEHDFISIKVDLATVKHLEFNAKIQTEEKYDSNIKVLRDYLNKSTVSGMSFYNKDFKFNVEGLETNSDVIDSPVVITIKEV